jgi:hypothetical protein
VGERCGVLYVATQNLRCLAEAFLSAASVKQHLPDVPVAIVTDVPPVAEHHHAVFDHVIPASPTRRYAAEWRRGLFDKVGGIVRTPFDRTLFLDTDTRVLDPAARDVFAWLDEHDVAMVPCTPESSRSCEIFGRPMLNSGVIAYRRTAAVEKLLARWEELTVEFFELAEHHADPPSELLAHVADPRVRRWLLQTDQVSLSPILSPTVNPFGVKLLLLDERWNHRFLPPPGNPERIRIAHCMEYKVRPDDSPGVLGMTV